MAGQDEGFGWNPETGRWDDGPRAPYTPPPPPRPEFAPRPHPDPEGGQHPPTEGGFGPGAGPGPGRPDSPVAEQHQYAAGDQGEFGPDGQWRHAGPVSRSTHPVPPQGPGGPWYRGRAGAVAAVLALALMGGGLGGLLLAGSGDGDRGEDKPSASASAGSAPGPSEPPVTAETSAPPTTPSAPKEPPPGYRAVTEGEFSLVVPKGWQRRTKSGEKGVTLYYYEQSGGPRRVQVFPVTEEDATPRGTLELAETFIDGAPGYDRHSLKDLPDDPRGPAAELDYSADSQEFGVRLRTVDRVVRGADGQLWTVLSQGPAADWPAQRKVHRTVLRGLCFGTEC
ncbi:hypothetical protein ABZ929_02455 [Streptomyces physcomitrii]|uniref:hypothetical protein n=1 Tax=Streptomyces physcomitrii TaxID=2724184 RepID=UPI0033E7017B